MPLRLVFALLSFCHILEYQTDVSKNLIWQLIKSGTSIGANLEEGQAGQTKPDFITKNAIALKEARESNYWLRIILGSYELDASIAVEANELKEESREIALIVGAIIVRAQK